MERIFNFAEVIYVSGTNTKVGFGNSESIPFGRIRNSCLVAYQLPGKIFQAQYQRPWLHHDVVNSKLAFLHKLQVLCFQAYLAR